MSVHQARTGHYWGDFTHRVGSDGILKRDIVVKIGTKLVTLIGRRIHFGDDEIN